MNGCVIVDMAQLWAGVLEGLTWAMGGFIFVGGLIGILGWKRPTRMAWLHNKLMLGLIFLISVPAGFLALMGSISAAFYVDAACVEAGKWWLRFLDPNSDWNTAIVVLPTAAAVILASVYFFKTARPAFLVEKTGKGTVDEVIARYRRAGEQVLVARSRLVVDGKGYYQAFYYPEPEDGEIDEARTAFLVVDEDGQVVEDEALAVRVMRVGQAALELGDPTRMEHRWWMYSKALPRYQKGVGRVREGLGQVREVLAEMGEDEVQTWLGWIEAGLVLEEEMAKVQREDWRRLGEWSWAKGGPKMKELREEEVEAMERALQTLRYLAQQERLGVLAREREGMERLKGWLGSEGGRRLKEKAPWAYALLEEVVGLWEEELQEAHQEFWERVRRGKLRWFDIGEEDLTAWRRRLAWVKQVDAQAGRATSPPKTKA